MIGKLLALPIRIVNVPARAFEKLFGDTPKSSRILSKPLESLAEAVEETLEGE